MEFTYTLLMLLWYFFPLLEKKNYCYSAFMAVLIFTTAKLLPTKWLLLL